jgi:sterol desaturase/sphingolipid hydroxylase (fatty acid hydroxylase superfamily)
MDHALEFFRQHGDWRDLTLLALSPLFVLCIAIEALRFRKSGLYDWQDSLMSMNSGGSFLLADFLLLIGLVIPALNWVYAHRWLTLELTPWSGAALFLGVELCYYAFHRASHRIRWFWCAHVVHHGSEHMNFTTALRQSWLYAIAGNWLFYTPLVWLGFEPHWVLFVLSLNLGFQFFVHTQWVKKLPAWFEWIFNTPSHHRAHHGRNPVYLDCNFGGTLIVFDRLFGSFVPEEEAVDFGLLHPVPTRNLVWLNLHEWVAMGRDCWREWREHRSWSLALKHLWAPPEWRRGDELGRQGP